MYSRTGYMPAIRQLSHVEQLCQAYRILNTCAVQLTEISTESRCCAAHLLQQLVITVLGLRYILDILYILNISACQM